MADEEPDLSQEKQLADLLAAYDDGLAAGALPPPGADAPGSPELAGRLQEDLACLHLLDRLLRKTFGEGVRGQGSGVSTEGASSRTPDPSPLTPFAEEAACRY